MAQSRRKPRVRLRVVLSDEVAIGPGKADLLEGVRATGSIAAAGRAMGMSYKRAWHLIETMNGCFDGPVVEKAKGGAAGGGARLTALGEEVLARFRHMEALTAEAAASDLRVLVRRLRRVPR